jgi:hypothetical protein
VIWNFFTRKHLVFNRAENFRNFFPKR